MTDQERELYQRAAADCHAIADGLDPDDCMRRPYRVIAEDLERRLRDYGVPPQPRRPARPRCPRGHLHAVPTQEGV